MAGKQSIYITTHHPSQPIPTIHFFFSRASSYNNKTHSIANPKSEYLIRKIKESPQSANFILFFSERRKHTREKKTLANMSILAENRHMVPAIYTKHSASSLLFVYPLKLSLFLSHFFSLFFVFFLVLPFPTTSISNNRS